MESSYSIDKKNNLLIKTHVGEITVDSEIEFLTKIISDPDYRSGMPAFCDFRKVVVKWSLADLDRFRTFVRRNINFIGDSRWALLVSPGADTSTGRIFIALNTALEKNIEVKLFSDEQQATDWLIKSDTE